MMRPRHFETPDEEPEPIRIPEEHGQLLPPSRRPPTAVGTATPRPHDQPGPPIPQKVSRLTRIARSVLGTGLVAGGIALATLPTLTAGLGVALALLGTNVIVRAATDHGLVALWRSRGRRGRQPAVGESHPGHLRRSA